MMLQTFEPCTISGLAQAEALSYQPKRTPRGWCQLLSMYASLCLIIQMHLAFIAWFKHATSLLGRFADGSCCSHSMALSPGPANCAEPA